MSQVGAKLHGSQGGLTEELWSSFLNQGRGVLFPRRSALHPPVRLQYRQEIHKHGMISGGVYCVCVCVFACVHACVHMYIVSSAYNNRAYNAHRLDDE